MGIKAASGVGASAEMERPFEFVCVDTQFVEDDPLQRMSIWQL